MRRTRWITVLAAIFIGVVAAGVSLVVGGGWGLIVLEVGGVALACFLFWRAQTEEDSSPGGGVNAGVGPRRRCSLSRQPGPAASARRDGLAG